LWLPILRPNVSYYERLSTAEQQELQRTIEVFVAEKNFEGCGGLEITEGRRFEGAGKCPGNFSLRIFKSGVRKKRRAFAV